MEPAKGRLTMSLEGSTGRDQKHLAAPEARGIQEYSGHMMCTNMETFHISSTRNFVY
jgi:hypothetical protein